MPPSKLEQKPRVTIVGGGIVGTVIAIRLLLEKYPVRVIAELPITASTAAASGGMFSTINVFPLSTIASIKDALPTLFSSSAPVSVRVGHAARFLPWALRMLLSLGQEKEVSKALHSILEKSLDEYEEILKASKAGAQIRQNGALVLYDDRVALEADSNSIESRRAYGIPVSILDKKQIQTLEPALEGRGSFAAFYPTVAHIVDLTAFLNALQATVPALGGEVVSDHIINLELDYNGFGVIRAHSRQRSYPIEKLVVAAGSWSRQLLSPLWINIPLEPERGYNITTTGPTRLTRPIILTKHKIGIVPNVTGSRVIGSTEFGGFSYKPSHKRYAAMERAAKECLPEISFLNSHRTVGLRPTTPDWLPVIGKTSGIPNLILAFGHQHIGLTTAAATARMVSEILSNQPSSINIDPFSPERFKSALWHTREHAMLPLIN